MDYPNTPTETLYGLMHIARKRIGTGRYHGAELTALYDVLAKINTELDRRENSYLTTVYNRVR